MKNAPVARWLTRGCGIIVLGFTVLYLLLALLPFYGNGIHLHSYQEIAGSFVDVKDHPPFVWFGVGGLAQVTAMLAAGFIPYFSPLFTPLMLILLGWKWRSFIRIEGSFWAATGVLNIVSLALTWQIHDTIMTWLVD